MQGEPPMSSPAPISRPKNDLEGLPPLATDRPLPNFSELFSTVLRGGCQLLGIFLVILGVYYAAYLFGALWELRKEASALAAQVEALETILGEDLVIQDGETKLSLAKPLAVLMVIAIYGILARLALALVSTGASLVYKQRDSRQELALAIREILRQQSSM